MSTAHIRVQRCSPLGGYTHHLPTRLPTSERIDPITLQRWRLKAVRLEVGQHAGQSRRILPRRARRILPGRNWHLVTSALDKWSNRSLTLARAVGDLPLKHGGRYRVA